MYCMYIVCILYVYCIYIIYMYLKILKWALLTRCISFVWLAKQKLLHTLFTYPITGYRVRKQRIHQHLVSSSNNELLKDGIKTSVDCKDG
jgi:hypothetical protein